MSKIKGGSPTTIYQDSVRELADLPADMCKGKVYVRNIGGPGTIIWGVFAGDDSEKTALATFDPGPAPSKFEFQLNSGEELLDINPTPGKILLVSNQASGAGIPENLAFHVSWTKAEYS